MINKLNKLPFHESYRIIDHAEDFIYLLPHPGLCNWISNYTITFPSKGMISDNYTVLPHGSATLVFSCDSGDIYGNLFGPSSKPYMVGNEANQFEMLCIIEFQPAGLYTYTGITQKELSNLTLPFELVEHKLNKSITEILYRAQHMYDLICALDQLLLMHPKRSSPPELQHSLKSIIANWGRPSVAQLSDAVFYSERQFHRLFDQYIGISAKSFSRLVRMNKAVRLLQNPRNSITKVCHLCSFYDLPHFHRDFKSVCGFTPQEYRIHMSDFYNEIAKF